MHPVRNLALVFAGGFCGTLARALFSAPITSLTLTFFPHAAPHFPWDIFAINLAGALALFYLAASLALGVGCAWAGYNMAGDLIRRRVVKADVARIDVVPTLEEDMEDEVVD
jgi:fluoride ion exporter CrcB/FEX